MALRYEFDVDNALLVRREPDRVVPRFPTPPVVEFRPNAALEGLVQQLVAHDRVRLSAAMGAGKSVKVPAAVASQTRGLVVHCVPSNKAAYSLQQYVSTITDVPNVFLDGKSVDLPDKGLVFLNGATLVLYLLRVHAGVVSPPRFRLFLDECHESDCFSKVLGDVASGFDCVTQVVFSSGTFDPKGGRKPEPAGTRIDHVLPDIDVTDWHPEDIGKPWSIDRLDGDALIYLDRKAVADKMAASYVESGYIVKRLTSRMTVAEFSQVTTMLKVNNRPVAVLIADYSFRSSFTFPTVRHLINSGEVKYYAMYEGTPAKLYRHAFDFENAQTGGRGGRASGSVTHVWQPASKDYVMCDLEGTEVDAAVLLYRMFGYKTPKSFAGTLFYDGLVPDDINEAFMGAYPMFAWPRERLTTWVNGVVAPERPPVVCMPVSRPPSGSGRPNLRTRSSVDGSLEALAVPGWETENARPVRDSSRASPSRVPSPVAKQTSSVSPGVADDIATGVSDALVGQFKSTLSVLDSSQTGFAELVASGSGFSPSRVDEGANKPPSGVKPVDSCVPAGLRGMSTDVEAALTQAVAAMTMDVENGSLHAGSYCYYPGMESVSDPTAVFHGGLEAVNRLVKKQTVVDGWDYRERLTAAHMLVEEHNLATARYNAVRRIAASLPEVQTTMKSLVNPVVMTDWLKGLSEQATADKAVVVSCFDNVLRVFPHGLVKADEVLAEAYAKCEGAYVKTYVKQLEMVAGEKSAGEQDRYAASAGRLTENGLLLETTKHKALMPSEHRRANSDLSVMRPATSRELVITGNSEHRTVAKYKLAPSSGLPSLVARAIVKAVGKGDMQVIVD